MSGRIARNCRTVCNLMSAALGALLITAPWLTGEAGDSTATSSAVFAGALILRVSASAALQSREWKAWTAVAAGFWLAEAPWLLHWDGLPGLSRSHHIVGLAVVALGLAVLWISRTRLDPAGSASFGNCRRSLLSSDGGQGC